MKDNNVDIARHFAEICEDFKKYYFLNNWDISVVIVGNSEVGENKMLYNEYSSVIYINEILNEEEMYRVFFHELAHIYLRDTHNIIDDLKMSDDYRTLSKRLFERENEMLGKVLYKLYFGIKD